MIDQIIDYNKTFVAQKGYEKFITDKYPDKKLAVLSCMPPLGCIFKFIMVCFMVMGSVCEPYEQRTVFSPP